MTQINTPQNTLFNKANEQQYIIDQSLMNLNTILLCEIELVNNNNSFDVRSLINYLDNSKKPITPPLLFNLPKLEIRGGIAGVIVEPIVGDKVIVGFAQRDISAIKKHLSRQNPASLRKFSAMDGIILGIISNTPPSIYVKITSDGVTIDAVNKPITVQTTGDTLIKASNAKIEATTLATIKAPIIKLEGIVEVTSSMTIATTLSVNGKDFATHNHSNGTYTNPAGAVTGISGSVS